MKLSDLEEGDRFRLVRTGQRYLLKKKGGTRYQTKPIGRRSELVGYKSKVSTLHHACFVEKIE